MARRFFLRFSACAAGALSMLCAAACDSVEPPRDAAPIDSAILIIVDTLRADRLGTYGYNRPTSPNLDRLALDGVVFEHAYSQAPNTPPSVASILTSLYPSSHHFTGTDDHLPVQAVTLAELLDDSGRRTGAFVDGGFLDASFGLGQGFGTYTDDSVGLEEKLPLIERWLDDVGDAPFFLLVHTYDVHSPYEHTPEPFRSMFTDPADPATLASNELEAIRTGQSLRPIKPSEIEHLSSLYDGGIRHVDELLGRFLAGLEQSDILHRSLVMVTSDHGEAFMEHGEVLHARLYRNVTHVPLILRMPARAFAGSRVSEVVESIDIAPTILDALGVAPWRGMQGRSLVPRIQGVRLNKPRAVSELPWNLWRQGYYLGDWHAIFDKHPENTRLFDLRNDPTEQRDVRSRNAEQMRSLRADMTARLREAHKRDYLEPADAKTDNPMDDTTRDSLRALGYLE